MSVQSSDNNKRIAKNTLLLYFRMFLLMGIGLFTSRVTLQVLGVDNFGIYNVVGGFVVMFSILSSSLTSAISRFITVELGKRDIDRLRIVFSTSVRVQIILSFVVAVLAEAIGIWFLYNKMSIPDGRYTAAQWVLHCSILSFVVGLISVPYNSAIVAHEKMSAFAYISILEATLKLVVVYSLLMSPYDKLIVYALLLLAVQLFLRIVYGVYCYKHFEECKGKPIFDMSLFKEMWGFAGWNLLGNGAYILNTQGVNMVMNVFFGVALNAARGVCNQVNNSVSQFVNNFTMAINPQITKSYAAGDKDYAFRLACRGAKFSYLMLFLLILPIMLEADQILRIWLGTPPEQSSIFLIWTLLATLTTITGGTLVTLMMAHGDIKRYQILITAFGFLPFPLSWIAFEFGAPAVWAFIIYFIVYYILIYVRMWLVHDKTGLPYMMYMKEVIFRTHIVSILSFIPAFIVTQIMDETIFRFLLTCVVSVCASSLFIYAIGLQSNERKIIKTKFIVFLAK